MKDTKCFGLVWVHWCFTRISFLSRWCVLILLPAVKRWRYPLEHLKKRKIFTAMFMAGDNKVLVSHSTLFYLDLHWTVYFSLVFCIEHVPKHATYKSNIIIKVKTVRFVYLDDYWELDRVWFWLLRRLVMKLNKRKSLQQHFPNTK